MCCGIRTTQSQTRRSSYPQGLIRSARLLRVHELIRRKASMLLLCPGRSVDYCTTNEHMNARGHVVSVSDRARPCQENKCIETDLADSAVSSDAAPVVPSPQQHQRGTRRRGATQLMHAAARARPSACAAFSRRTTLLLIARSSESDAVCLQAQGAIATLIRHARSCVVHSI